MALYQSKGIISAMSEVTSGTSQSGFAWQHMDITLDVPGYQGSITKQIFRVSGDKVDAVLQYKVGDKVQIGFSLYAREWKERWYNTVELVTITDEAGAVKTPPAEAAPSREDNSLDPKKDDLPF